MPSVQTDAEKDAEKKRLENQLEAEKRFKHILNVSEYADVVSMLYGFEVYREAAKVTLAHFQTTVEKIENLKLKGYDSAARTSLANARQRCLFDHTEQFIQQVLNQPRSIYFYGSNRSEINEFRRFCVKAGKTLEYYNVDDLYLQELQSAGDKIEERIKIISNSRPMPLG